MANRLVDILKNDKNALKRFSGVSSKEGALKVAQGLITGYTEEELLKDIQNIQESSVTESSLSSRELETVVGGTFNWGGFFAATVPTLLTTGMTAYNAWQSNKDGG